jgi:hypothetical protein
MTVQGVRGVLALVSVLAVAAAAGGLLAARGSWLAARDGGGIEAPDRVAFMALAGIVVSASFLVGTIWAGLTPVLIGGCGGMR